jgi:Uncharacterized flagellar protein FlaG
MAIEPLGSIMTIQSQTVQKPAEVKPAVENTEVSTPEQTAYVDPVTVSVAKVENDDEKNAGTDDAQDNKQQQAANEKIRKAVEKLNKNMPQSEAVFGVHDETNRVTIKIVDKDSKEVIKEFPPEKTLDMIAKVWELAGILVDEKL